MTSVIFVLRLVSGGIIFILGLSGFFHFLPNPDMSEAGEAFLIALVETEYFLPMLKVLSMICGTSLLLGYYIPLCLVLLTPMVIQIFLFCIFLEPIGIPISIFLVVVNVLLIYFHRNAFRSLLEQKIKTN